MSDEPETEVVEVVCLHCHLAEAFDEWMKTYVEATGSGPTVRLIGHCVGAMLEDLTGVVLSQGNGDFNAVLALRQALMEGQMKQRKINEAEAEPEKAAEPVEPDPNTRH